MADIHLDSVALQERSLKTHHLIAQVTLASGASTIDVEGLTVTESATGFTLTGFEAESGVSLDSSRRVGAQFLNLGTVASAEESDIWILSALITGSEGTRTITFDVNIAAAAALDLTSDSITDGVLELYLPIK